MPPKHLNTPLLLSLVVSVAAATANRPVLADAPAVGALAQFEGRGPRGRPGGSPPGQEAKPEGEKKDEEKKDEKGDEKKEEDSEKKDGDDKPEAPKPVTRPNEPPKPPDPRELEAKPDESGRVSFSFNGQPWADVLQWLAAVSDLSLDWRELPGDYLNLTTQRAYPLPEARDLINRHLQARGYALLLSGEVLSVVKLSELEPSLVPRVDEEELYDRQPHDIVKLSLELPPGLEASKAVEDLKQAMGPHAKALPLAATKRVLLIDNVANLRMVSALLNSERVAAEGREVPREFFLEYVQASEVIDILYVVLGLDPNSRPSQMELRMQQQKLELMQQMAQRGQDVAKLLQKEGPPVYLAYNRQRNSVLANAPPAEMRVIARAIEALDVPSTEAPTAGDPGDRTLEQYRLKTIAPQAVIDTLNEIGNLSPRAELRGDADSKTLFARASQRDHTKIGELIEQLDGAETVVEVFWLRRLPAEAVAGSIQALIIEKPKEDDDDDMPWYYSYRRNRDSDEEEPDTILRVDADIENNRLIARGTPRQMEEIRDLLTKLGEPPLQEYENRNMRVFDALGPEETARLLRQIESAWPAIGGETELVLPPDAQEDEPKATDDSAEEDAKTEPRTTAQRPPNRFRLLNVSDGGADEEAEPAAKATKPKATVQLDSSGRIVVASDDPATLARLESLVEQLAPAPDRYRVFPVKNRNPEDIVDSLETYFSDFLAEEEDDFSRYLSRRFGDDDEPVKLSRRQPLRFLADDWSSTILVANATPDQLAEIGRLIDAWDRQPIDDRVVVRRTRTIALEYAKASTVVAAVKEVYREMLSRGDKEFDTPENKGRSSLTRYLTQLDTRDGASEPAFIGFDGLLSLGADDEANVVIVSARDEVFQSVVETIREIDQQAKPTTTVRVVPMEGGLATGELRNALLSALSAQGAAVSTSSNDGDRDRRRDRRRRGRGR
ncbi:secretin N-terminal domain-containing protein [Botrimarina sp.]|uniref:secretin N-terminal domain-containing protein n=1 Tax=Botrimarina sp. TaxID=2795802 RepID=UPI0032ECE485